MKIVRKSRLKQTEKARKEDKLTTGARRPPKTIIPVTKENDVRYSCFKVFVVWLSNIQKGQEKDFIFKVKHAVI